MLLYRSNNELWSLSLFIYLFLLLFFQVLLVVTDGKSQSGQALLKIVSNSLTARGINIYAIGVGSKVNRQELQIIASDDHNIYHVNSARYLSQIAKKIQTQSCKSNNHVFALDRCLNLRLQFLLSLYVSIKMKKKLRNNCYFITILTY